MPGNSHAGHPAGNPAASARETIRRHVWIEGRVQGVFFRVSLQDAARRRRVTGWTGNLPDGRVEAVLQGATTDVEQVVEWCRQGPPAARVDRVRVENEPVEAETVFTFDIRG